MKVGIVIATLTLLIIIAAFLLFFTKHNKKAISEQKIFYSDIRSENILTGEEALKNILGNKSEIKI